MTTNTPSLSSLAAEAERRAANGETSSMRWLSSEFGARLLVIAEGRCFEFSTSEAAQLFAESLLASAIAPLIARAVAAERERCLLAVKSVSVKRTYGRLSDSLLRYDEDDMERWAENVLEKCDDAIRAEATAQGEKP